MRRPPPETTGRRVAARGGSQRTTHRRAQGVRPRGEHDAGPRGEQGAGTSRLERFDLTERWLHWTMATILFVLIATGAILYVGALSAMVGRRELIETIHVVTGIALPVPVTVALLRRRRSRMLVEDLRRLNRWSMADRRWLRTWGRDPLITVGKFNAGQKLNASFVAGASLVMLGTGLIMKWFGPFPLSWRSGATFVHDLVSVAIVVVVAGHIMYALSSYNREPLKSMVRGWISEDWAAHHAPGWLEELRARSPDPTGDEPAGVVTGPSQAGLPGEAGSGHDGA